MPAHRTCGSESEVECGSVAAKVYEILRTVFNITDRSRILVSDLRIQEDLNGDSLDLVEFVMELEDEFEIVITDPQVSEIKTIGDAICLVSAILADRPGGE